MKLLKKIKQDWIFPQFVTVHWDSKANHTLQNKNKHEERLVVAAGTQDLMKILGIPSYKSTRVCDRPAGTITTEIF